MQSPLAGLHVDFHVARTKKLYRRGGGGGGFGRLFEKREVWLDGYFPSYNPELLSELVPLLEIRKLQPLGGSLRTLGDGKDVRVLQAVSVQDEWQDVRAYVSSIQIVSVQELFRSAVSVQERWMELQNVWGEGALLCVCVCQEGGRGLLCSQDQAGHLQELRGIGARKGRRIAGLLSGAGPSRGSTVGACEKLAVGSGIALVELCCLKLLKEMQEGEGAALRLRFSDRSSSFLCALRSAWDREELRDGLFRAQVPAPASGRCLDVRGRRGAEEKTASLGAPSLPNAIKTRV